MILKKIIPAILYLCVAPSALSGETSDLVTGTITVKDSFVDSRIMKFPATVETYDKKQIEESVNAATPAQTLKYLPSIQVRERSIGDRNGIISSRTIGSVSSAQSMLYADGVLLSNLLGNSFSYPPRWGMVNPEEIQRISMMYGPFSSLYAGNSLGGVIHIETRMPERLEAHAGVQSFTQNFKLYGTDQTKIGNREFFSIGNKVNDFSFWASMNRLENTAQPLDFSVANLAVGETPTAEQLAAKTLVTGNYNDKGILNQDRVIFGATAIDTSIQTNGKFKGQYEFSNQSKLTYTIGLWDLDSRQNVQSYIKDTLGNSIYGGDVILGGKLYSKISRMNPVQAEAFHVMQSIDFKSSDKGFFNWQITLSDYDYSRDLSNRSALTDATNTNPYIKKTGQITDLSGTGWTVFDGRVTLRPKDHTIDLGYHLDYYHLRQTVNASNDWMGSQKEGFASLSSGNTKTHAVYVQDKWQITPLWALTLGARQEHYEAYDGVNQNTTNLARYEDRSRNTFSPKVSLSFEPIPAWGFRAAFGKAYRFPTVTELFQQLTSNTTIVTNNPNLKPEEIYSSEITAERRFANGLARASLFREDRYDALISQTNVSLVGTSRSYVQNVDHARIYGIELATEWKDVMIPKLDLLANATLTDSEILKNDAAPSYINKKVPRIPRQLYKAVATYRVSEDFTMSLAARYSGRQFIQLDNSDINPETYAGASRLLFVDAKANYKFKDRWTASLGIDNIFNDQAYVHHPLSQRTGYAQIKFDY